MMSDAYVYLYKGTMQVALIHLVSFSFGVWFRKRWKHPGWRVPPFLYKLVLPILQYTRETRKISQMELLNHECRINQSSDQSHPQVQ